MKAGCYTALTVYKDYFAWNWQPFLGVKTIKEAIPMVMAFADMFNTGKGFK